MRILIYGAGVIGSLYGALFAQTGEDVTVYARGKRLQTLKEKGLRYRKDGMLRSTPVKILSHLAADDRYDLILLAVRENQVRQALRELKENCSPTIVTMVNTTDPYEKWEEICGKGRILPAFPGAGGGFKDGILEADLTPEFIQPTMIGRTDGRENVLAELFHKAKIPYRITEDLHRWQICHLAMVVPLADAYYESADPMHVSEDRELMQKTAIRIRDNMNALKEKGIELTPSGMNVFSALPVRMVASVLRLVYRSSFGERFMYQYSMKAPDEMRELHSAFYAYLQEKEDNRKEDAGAETGNMKKILIRSLGVLIGLCALRYAGRKKRR